MERCYGLDDSEPATLGTMARALGVDTPSTRRIEREVFAKMRAASAVLDILHGRTPSRTTAQLGYARLQPVALP